MQGSRSRNCVMNNTLQCSGASFSGIWTLCLTEKVRVRDGGVYLERWMDDLQVYVLFNSISVLSVFRMIGR